MLKLDETFGNLSKREEAEDRAAEIERSRELEAELERLRAQLANTPR